MVVQTTFTQHETMPAMPPIASGRPERAVVVIPTYNERETIVPLIREVLEATADADVLIVDDGSPDGTGTLADGLAGDDPRVSVIHRAGKLGFASAYREGFERALERGYDVVAQMDADFSHRPEDLPRLLDGARSADVVVGSRNVPGGRTENWPLIRTLVSRGGSLYTRAMLRLPIRDCTSGFKCIRREALADIDLSQITAAGFGFQVEMNYRLHRAGKHLTEVPIVFPDRTAGQSKMSKGIALEALRLVWRLRREERSQASPRWWRRILAEHGGQFARFAVVGGAGVLVNTGVLALLVEIAGLAPLVAAGIATETAILTNFVLNDTWTFRGSGRRSSRLASALRYNVYALGGLVITLATLAALTRLTGLHYLVANLIAIGAATIWNYAANARWTWGGNRQPAAARLEAWRG